MCPTNVPQNMHLHRYTEFFREGDADRAKGRKLNPLHDRHTTVMAKETVGFINFMVGDCLAKKLPSQIQFLSPHFALWNLSSCQTK